MVRTGGVPRGLVAGALSAALLFAALPLADGTLWTLLCVDVVFLLTITLFRAPLVALMPDHVAPRERSDAGCDRIGLLRCDQVRHVDDRVVQRRTPLQRRAVTGAHLAPVVAHVDLRPMRTTAQ